VERPRSRKSKYIKMTMVLENQVKETEIQELELKVIKM
jgi:hypothetical protein